MPSSITVIKFPQLTKAAKCIHTSHNWLRRLRPVATTSSAKRRLFKALVSQGDGYEAVFHQLVAAFSSLSTRTGNSGGRRFSKLQLLLWLDAKVVNSRIHGVTQWISRSLQRFMRNMRSWQRVRSLSPMVFVRPKRKRHKAFNAMFRAAGIFAVVVARVRRRVVERARSLRVMAIHFVETMTTRLLPLLAADVTAKMLEQSHKQYVAIIERAWCDFRFRRCELTRRKKDLIDMLLLANTEMLELKMEQHKSLEATQKAVNESSHAIYTDVKRRLSVRLIQRVWRGSRARRYVDQLIPSKKRETCQKVQRERIQAARQFLWTQLSSEREVLRAQQARVAARKMNASMWKNNKSRGYWSIRRETVGQPLAALAKGSKMSSAEVRPIFISVFDFEKINSRTIRMNPLRVYIKIPVSNGCKTGKQDDKSLPRLRYEPIPASLLRQSDRGCSHPNLFTTSTHNEFCVQ